MDGKQPGQLIVPHDTQESETSQTDLPQEAPLRPEQSSEQLTAEAAPEQVNNLVPQTVIPEEVAVPPTEPTTGWQFRPEDTTNVPSALSPGEEVSWTASEFIAHEKSASWYGLLALGAVVIIVLTYFVSGHDMISTITILLVAVVFGMFAARKPKVLQYALSDVGLHIAEKTYGYEDFKSFSVTEEGAIVSIVFMPLKRFMPSLTIYLAPELEDKVIGVLNERLPMEAHRQDAVDGFLKRIRF